MSKYSYHKQIDKETAGKGDCRLNSIVEICFGNPFAFFSVNSSALEYKNKTLSQFKSYLDQS